MRVAISDVARPKAAAKMILKLKGAGQLSQVHESLAELMGYGDWYDLAKNGGGVPGGLPSALDETRDFIIKLDDGFGLGDADAQYSVTRTRLISDRAWTLDEELVLTAAVWRARRGPPGRGRPGTVVKVHAHRETRHAYLIRTGRPTFVLYDQGPGISADFQAITPRVPLPDFVPKFLWLPYGFWTLRDGSEVVFGREYQPLWHVEGDRIRRADPWEWIDNIRSQIWFGGQDTNMWSRGIALDRALEYLRSRRISGLPRLLNAMPYFLDSAVDDVSDAVELLKARSERSSLEGH
jgi:hypothetical protein